MGQSSKKRTIGNNAASRQEALEETKKDMKHTPLKSKNTLKRKTPLKAPKGADWSINRSIPGGGFKSSNSLNKRSSGDQALLDSIFSEYVRRLHADQYGAVQCVTCGIYRRWNDRMDAGHFIPRQHMATRYDIYNVFPQCRTCNRDLAGNIDYFSRYIIQAFGENAVEELKEKGKTVLHGFPYKERIKEFRFKLAALKVAQDNEIQY